MVTVRLTCAEGTDQALASEQSLVFQLGSDGVMGNELFQVDTFDTC